MKKHDHLLAFLLAAALIFTACEPDPIDPNQEEVITTLKFTLTPDGGGTPILMTFQDLDGDGGNAPVITGGILASNQTYTGALELLNEAESPAEDITEEIEEEDEDHQFFFESDIAGLTIAYNDMDADGNPVGLSSIITTGDVGTGSITIILRHEPAKSATGVAGGDITNAGGETDIEVSLPVEVQ